MVRHRILLLKAHGDTLKRACQAISAKKENNFTLVILQNICSQNNVNTITGTLQLSFFKYAGVKYNIKNPNPVFNYDNGESGNK